MHTAEHNVLRIGLTGETRKLQRVAGDIGVLEHIGALIVVAEQHGTRTKLGTGGIDAYLRLLIGEYVEGVKWNGSSLHERLRIQATMNA